MGPKSKKSTSGGDEQHDAWVGRYRQRIAGFTHHCTCDGLTDDLLLRNLKKALAMTNDKMHLQPP